MVPTSMSEMSTSKPRGRAVASASTEMLVRSWFSSTSEDATSPTSWTGTSMRDLLAAADHDQVDVVDGLLQRVALDVLGERELGAAVEIEAQQDVGVAAQRQPDLAGGQRDVARRLAVAVDDGGNQAGATGATGSAFAELGALLGADTDLGHGGTTPRTLAISTRNRGATTRDGGRDR